MPKTTLTPDRVAHETHRLIEFNPERHDQGRFMTVIDDDPCKSTACAAGHAAVIAGLVEWRTDVDPRGNWHRVSDGMIMDANMIDGYDDLGSNTDDVSDAWFELGMQALDIPEMLATLLFDHSVPRGTVRVVLYELAYGTDHDTITLSLDNTFTRVPFGIGPRRSTLPYVRV